jgi:probable rRNA maturation factor
VVATLPDGIALGGEGLAALSSGDRAWLEDALARVVPLLPVPVARAELELVRDARMRALHARHLAIDETTDVMTFAQNAPGAPIDADVAVCVDEARRRGTPLAHGMRGELLLYVLHALLHACGHDDRDAASHARMHAEEDRILEAAGFGRLFEAGEGAS